jgi:hypothetical protein
LEDKKKQRKERRKKEKVQENKKIEIILDSTELKRKKNKERDVFKEYVQSLPPRLVKLKIK